jgi:hypothetical protein
MITRSLAAALVAGAVSLAPATLAFGAQGAEKKAPAAKPEIPKPAAEMAQLKVFDGSWTCDGTMNPSPFGPGGSMKSTVKSQTDLGGFWQSGTVKSTMEGMPPMEGMFHMTYDPAARQYVMLWVDNTGAWAHTTSTGWTGDKIVFAGDTVMGGKKIASRDTFTKGSDGTLKHSAEAQLDGKWTAMGDETCRKGAGR